MRNSKGFLLLEVMVSVVIVTGGLLYVTRVYSTANEIVKRSRAMFEYGLLMEERMFEYEEKGWIKKDEVKEGGFPELKERKNLFWKIAPTNLYDKIKLDISEVTLEIYETKGAKKVESRTLTTYLENKR